MDAQQALADLTEISSQIQAAVVFDEQGNVAAATLDDTARADELAGAAKELLAAADDVKPGESRLAQLEVATREGSVFVVRDGDGKTWIAATTGSNPTVGLVFYDLKSALRNVKPQPKPKPARKPAAKKTATGTPASKKKTTTARKTTPRKRKTDAS
jgi:predicted regulator of Ras-like GTPase activity (Roadblock/LC7/MglB family)